MVEPTTARARPSRLRTLTIGMLVIGVALSIGLLLGEVMVRMVAPQQLILKRPDLWYGIDSLGWVKRPSVNTQLNTGEKEIHVYTDSLGQRIGSTGWKPGPPRILLLGDSFMEALQVEHEESLAGRLEAELTTQLGKPVAVRNTAVSGWDPNQYLTQARRSLTREPIDLVVAVIFVGNDLVDSQKPWRPARTPVEVHPFRLPRRLSWFEFVDAVLYPINDFLEVRSQLFILFKRQSGALRMRLGLSPDQLPRIYLRDQAPGNVFEVTAEISDSIAAAARATGAETIFVLLPESFQVETADAARFAKGSGVPLSALDLDRPNRLLAEALSAKGLTVIDVMPALRAGVGPDKRLYGAVDRHLTPEGHRIVVDVIEPLIQERLRRRIGRP